MIVWNQSDSCDYSMIQSKIFCFTFYRENEAKCFTPPELPGVKNDPPWPQQLQLIYLCSALMGFFLWALQKKKLGMVKTTSNT